MKIHLTFLVLFPYTLHASCIRPNLHHKPKHPHKHHLRPYRHPQKRDPQDTPPTDPLFGPSPIAIDLPAEFLPPPWSPSSELDSPYPSTGVSPWDDSGRSQMVDNEPSIWRMCPQRHLDCSKCPHDFRCRRPHISWNDETSSPQFGGIAPEDDGNGACPLSKCDVGGGQRCGANARCTRGFCVCDVGMKGSLTHGIGFRGNEGLGTVTVYQSPDADCDVPCLTLSCSEVEQVKVGVCWQSGLEAFDFGDGDGDGDESAKALTGVTYDNVGSGSVNLPGGNDVVSMAGDYVEGVADPALVGIAT